MLTFATAATVLTMVPLMSGSTSQPEKDSVVLAAGDSAGTPAAPPMAMLPLPPIDPATAAGGGGLFTFPSLALAPLNQPMLVAPSALGITFIRPVDGAISSGFGPRIHPLLGRPMFHTGLDLLAACGTPIRAAADGTVIQAGVSPSWGGRTIIQHSASLKTAYGHQSKLLVKGGDVVKQGQIIGLVGTTGWSTGCHLHFDVILNDRYVDPAPYLGLPSTHNESVPFYSNASGSVHQVNDGDVPISDATVIPPAGSTPTSGTTGTTGPTSSPTPTRTSYPTVTLPGPTSTTTSPTTGTTTSTTPPPDPTTSDPTTTSAPASSTGETTTQPPATSSEPPPPTSDPTTATTSATTSAATSDPTTDPTSAPSATTTAAATVTEAVTSTATAIADATESTTTAP